MGQIFINFQNFQPDRAVYQWASSAQAKNIAYSRDKISCALLETRRWSSRRWVCWTRRRPSSPWVWRCPCPSPRRTALWWERRPPGPGYPASGRRSREQLGVWLKLFWHKDQLVLAGFSFSFLYFKLRRPVWHLRSRRGLYLTLNPTPPGGGGGG